MISEAADQASKVKVHFFDSNRPHLLSTPESIFDSNEFLGMTQAEDGVIVNYNRQISENGSDNPFRPDGDISKEADEIVQMIKSGVSLDASLKQSSTPSPTPVEVNNKHGPMSENNVTETDGVKQTVIDQKVAKEKYEINMAPGPLDVKHEKISPVQAPAQAEHVVIKKKKKCVIQ